MFKTLLVFRVIGIFGGGFVAINMLFNAEGTSRGGPAWMVANYFYYAAFTDSNWGYSSAIITTVLLVSLITGGLTFLLTRRETVTY
jgi:ABC-type sugar transport system permease subunit